MKRNENSKIGVLCEINKNKNGECISNISSQLNIPILKV